MNQYLKCLTLITTAGLFMGGCQNAPAPSAPVVEKPKPAPVAEETEKEYTNMSVSEAKGVSSPFKTEKGTVFPENKMGYKLLLGSGVSMPNLITTQIDESDILVQARVYNRADYPQTLDIIFEIGEDKDTYNAKRVVFPANRARDIKFKLSQQATQSLCLIVSKSK